MKKLKLGWVGSGFVGQVAHLVNYVQIPEVEIVGLAELRPRLGRDVCQKYNIKEQYDNHISLIENCELDAVVAIVRREHTASIAMDILERGLPVFTEKPMAPTLEQGQKLVAVAAEKSLAYVTGFMRRHDQGVQLAKKTLDEVCVSGELGKVLYFRSYCFGGGDYCNIDGDIKTEEPAPRHRLAPIAPDWLPKELEKEYESFLNVFVHDINLIRYLIGCTPSVEYVDYRGASGSVILDCIKFPGVFEFAHLDTNKYWEEGIEIIFEKGRIRIELPPAFLRNQSATVGIYLEKSDGTMEHKNLQAGWSWAFQRQADKFVDSIIGGSINSASGQHCLDDLRVIESIWKKISGTAK